MSKMKKAVLSLGILSVLGVSNFASAADGTTGTINFSGALVRGTCTLAAPTAAVNFGTVSLTDFAGQPAGTDISKTKFTIDISCPSELRSSSLSAEQFAKVGVSFYSPSNSDETVPGLVKIKPEAGGDQTAGFGIRLMDGTTKIDIDKDTAADIPWGAVDYADAIGKTSTLTFTAALEPTGEGSAVTPGKFSAATEIKVAYN